MRSLYPNLLTLTEFTRLMGLNPWRVAGFDDPIPPIQAEQATGCTGVWAEYTYQRNTLSRSDLSLAIMEAEQQFATIIGYFPAPRWTTDEYHKYPVSRNAEWMRQASGKPKSVQLNFNKVISFGVQTCTKLSDSAVVYTTSPAAGSIDNNGVEVPVPDTATITVTVPSGANPAEYQVFFRDADRLGQPREQWGIRPLKLSVSGTTLTITGKSWQFVKPELYEGGDMLYVLDTAVYVTEVEVWHCVTDATVPGEFVWTGDGDCNQPPCAETTTPLCASLTGEKCPIVALTPATWDGTKFKTTQCLPVHRAPDGVRINYLSGVPLVSGQMQSQHAQVIAMLAASYLECEICACNCTKERLSKYSGLPDYISRRDVQFTGNVQDNKIYDDLENPLGKRYGQIQAWRIARFWQLCK